MKKLLPYFLLSFFPAISFGQAKNYKALADTAFNRHEYYTAAFYYKHIADGTTIESKNSVPLAASRKSGSKKETTNQYIIYQLAESYRLYKDYTDATIWYTKMSNEGSAEKYPLTPLWYGICLQANGKYDEALVQLKQFAERNQDPKYTALANKEIASCGYALKQLEHPRAVDVSPLVFLNKDQGDYALTVNLGRYWFTSSRMVDKDKFFTNRIYSSAILDSTKALATNFNVFDKEGQIEYATPSLDATGTKMYLTRWYKKNGKTVSAIYLSQLVSSVWQQPVRLNSTVNAEGYNSKHPHISPDGRRLFFSSDRPGGEGGDDIWESTLDDSGQPKTVSNLGNTVNTPYDEQSPYYDEADKVLFFSSTGFTGMGGFDVYRSDGDFGHWAAPVNLGYPVNSSKDDLYYSLDPTNANKFYLSSARGSDCCLSLFTGQYKFLYISGRVIDCHTNSGMVGARVILKDPNVKMGLVAKITDDKGDYVFQVKEKLPSYKLEISQKGYFTKVVPAPIVKPGIDTLINPETCLQNYKVNVPIIIENIYFDFGNAHLRAESYNTLDKLVAIMNDNPKIKIELGSHTDGIGSDAGNLKLSQARAETCVDYLLLQGIKSSRIKAKGYGKRMPIAPNKLPNGKDNPAGRQLNRRTTFTVKSAG
ncbi:OmpA family protein [Mucilaginibacter sp. SMC90]|uniref:OmpA family protein n=1 Tax=Mucilaginibacter sp. SMC90 TaxID=2929803 RepID=UPI001FB2B521|nr:OmpA family protein [Mucilaginibacter sp. SMC90]UOE48932.1 OmpA family protein [Mucilaginibacter sp. SMC90]